MYNLGTVASFPIDPFTAVLQCGTKTPTFDYVGYDMPALTVLPSTDFISVQLTDGKINVAATSTNPVRIVRVEGTITDILYNTMKG